MTGRRAEKRKGSRSVVNIINSIFHYLLLSFLIVDNMTNKKRKVEFEVEALKFVGLNDGKRLFRVWWRGHQSTDVIPEENFNDAMMLILIFLEKL